MLEVILTAGNQKGSRGEEGEQGHHSCSFPEAPKLLVIKLWWELQRMQRNRHTHKENATAKKLVIREYTSLVNMVGALPVPFNTAPMGWMKHRTQEGLGT